MEIEFQCWNTTYKEMNGDSYAKLILYKMSCGEEILDCKFRQYTGIKDKNGKKVFDGDIISINWQYVPNTLENINYNEEYAWWQYGNNPIMELLDVNQEFEVIGNIYEPLNLINKENGNKV